MQLKKGMGGKELLKLSCSPTHEYHHACDPPPLHRRLDSYQAHTLLRETMADRGRWMQCVLPLRSILLLLLTVYSLPTKLSSHLPHWSHVLSPQSCSQCSGASRPWAGTVLHTQRLLVASHYTSRGCSILTAVVGHWTQHTTAELISLSPPTVMW